VNVQVLIALIGAAVRDHLVVRVSESQVLDDANYDLKQFGEQAWILDVDKVAEVLLRDDHDVGLPTLEHVVECQDVRGLGHHLYGNASAQDGIAVVVVAHGLVRSTTSPLSGGHPTEPKARKVAVSFNG
jgi:hypothetical protein